jgi:hypothetical protein
MVAAGRFVGILPHRVSPLVGAPSVVGYLRRLRLATDAEERELKVARCSPESFDKRFNLNLLYFRRT